MDRRTFRLIPPAVKRFGLTLRASSALQSSQLRAPAKLVDARMTHPERIVLRKANGRLRIDLDLKGLSEKNWAFSTTWKRLPVMIRLFAATDVTVREAVACLGDANYESGPVMSFCSAEPAALLVPDRQFLKTQGYAEYRRLAADHPNNWDQRTAIVLWRGSVTGGPKALQGRRPLGAEEAALIPRLRMCQLLRDVPGTDVKVVTGKPSKRRVAIEILATERVLGGFVPQANWVHHKFALDIDGHSNAWTNFYIRLVLGCCVIKVASQGGYRQWYYDDLVPWRHFVPVRSDLADLRERIDWCWAHDAECRAIAAAGQEFALARTVASETAATLARLNAALAANGYRAAASSVAASAST